MYKAYITRIKNLRKHSNADRLQCGECFGNQVIVDLNTSEGQIGCYFPSDGKLGVEYATENNLLRKKNEEGNSVGGYLDPDKRNIKALSLRGEKSDGLFMPLESLSNFTNIKKLSEGDTIDVLNGIVICEKYIPYKKCSDNNYKTNKTRKKKVNIAPLFQEHVDTEQLAYNLSDFKVGDEIEITLKVHGTSQRSAYLPVLQGYKRTLLDKVFHKQGKPIYKWDYVTGTRRVLINEKSDKDGFYGSNKFRKVHADKFKGKLWKGEAVYFEIVGYTDTGRPIMGSVVNSKVKNKEFTKQYGEITEFSYGCKPDGIMDRVFENGDVEYSVVPQSDIYVYRMTMTNEDGDVVEYTPDFMRYRCGQMGVKTVPVLWQGIIPEIENDEALSEEYRLTPGDYIKSVAEQYYDGADPIGKIHIREGVVIRIVNKPSFTAFKHKNFNFKVLSNIAKLNVIDENKIENMSDDLISEI